MDRREDVKPHAFPRSTLTTTWLGWAVLALTTTTVAKLLSIVVAFSKYEACYEEPGYHPPSLRTGMCNSDLLEGFLLVLPFVLALLVVYTLVRWCAGRASPRWTMMSGLAIATAFYNVAYTHWYTPCLLLRTRDLECSWSVIAAATLSPETTALILLALVGLVISKRFAPASSWAVSLDAGDRAPEHVADSKSTSRDLHYFPRSTVTTTWSGWLLLALMLGSIFLIGMFTAIELLSSLMSRFVGADPSKVPGISDGVETILESLVLTMSVVTTLVVARWAATRVAPRWAMTFVLSLFAAVSSYLLLFAAWFGPCVLGIKFFFHCSRDAGMLGFFMFIVPTAAVSSLLALISYVKSMPLGLRYPTWLSRHGWFPRSLLTTTLIGWFLVASMAVLVLSLLEIAGLSFLPSILVVVVAVSIFGRWCASRESPRWTAAGVVSTLLTLRLFYDLHAWYVVCVEGSFKGVCNDQESPAFLMNVMFPMIGAIALALVAFAKSKWCARVSTKGEKNGSIRMHLDRNGSPHGRSWS